MLFVDGHPDSANAANSLGISIFGDGVFETLLLHEGKLHLQSLHMERLQRGAERLGLDFSEQAVFHELQSFIQHYQLENKTWRVRLVLARAYNQSGYSAQQSKTVRCLSAVAQPLPGFEPVSVNVSGIAISQQPQLAGIKHCNRLENILARQEQERSGFDESLLLDHNNCPVECIAANFFIVSDGCLLTPDLSSCGVAGTIREYILQTVSAELGLTTSIETLRLQDLLAADAFFICNSIRGVSPVSRFVSKAGQRSWSEFGLVKKIQQRVLASMTVHVAG